MNNPQLSFGRTIKKVGSAGIALAPKSLRHANKKLDAREAHVTYVEMSAFLVAVAFAVLVGYLVLVLIQVRKTVAKSEQLLTRIDDDLLPLLGDLRALSHRVNNLTEEARRGVAHAAVFLHAVGEVGESVQLVHNVVTGSSKSMLINMMKAVTHGSRRPMVTYMVKAITNQNVTGSSKSMLTNLACVVAGIKAATHVLKKGFRKEGGHHNGR